MPIRTDLTAQLHTHTYCPTRRRLHLLIAMNGMILLADSGSDPNPLLPEPYDIFWSAVVFIVVGFVFFKYVVPRLTKVLDERSDKIEGGLEKAEVAQEQAQATLAQYQQQLADARL